ncbi:MAG TPA: PorT family protein [Bacteroides sp.]|nr:PorT family protein [Bacteroides sp.]
MHPSRLITCVYLVMATVIPLQAQWEIGGIIDLNIAGISVIPKPRSESYSSRFGPGIGAVAKRQVTDRIGFRAEPMFLQKGARLHEGGDVIVFNINYLEFPLLITYDFRMDGPLVPYAMIGPSIGLLAGASFRYSDGWKQDETDNTRFFDFGAGLGGGVELPRGNKNFFAETRYVVGFVNVNRDQDESSVYNRGLQILVGVTIPVARN